MVTCPDIPNLRHLRMVQMIGRLGGVSCASRELNTSQPAVTQAVASLEADIGTEIFERCATGTYPTRAGQMFLLRIDRFFEILERAIHDIMGSEEQPNVRQLPLVERIITGTQIRSLIATSDPATVEHTAHELGVSPTSLYRSVRTLERTVKRPLFDRSAHGPICNKTGENLARQFRRAVREIEFARGEIKAGAGGDELEIVVGALPMSGTYELAHSVRIFTARRPSARVKVLTGDYHGLLDDLANCRIDMIFGLLRRPVWATDLHEEALFRDSYCLVTRPGHPLTKAKDITPEELKKFDWVVPASGTPRREVIEGLFDGVEGKPSFNIETSCLATSRALLLDSDLITVMTRSEVQLDASQGTIAVLPCRFLKAIPPKGVTTRTDWLPTELHAEFLDCLREATSGTHHEKAGKRPQIALAS